MWEEAVTRDRKPDSVSARRIAGLLFAASPQRGRYSGRLSFSELKNIGFLGEEGGGLLVVCSGELPANNFLKCSKIFTGIQLASSLNTNKDLKTKEARGSKSAE